MEIHERIKYAIDERFQTMKAFSEAAELPYTTVQGYVGGIRKPGADALATIVQVTGVSALWLLTEQGPMFDREAEKKGFEPRLLYLFDEWLKEGRWGGRGDEEIRDEARFFVHLFNNDVDLKIASDEGESTATALRSVFHGLDLSYFLYLADLGGEKEILARFFLEFEKTENAIMGKQNRKSYPRDAMIGMFCSVYNQRGASGLALPKWLSTPYPKITPEQVDDAIKWLVELKIQARPQQQGKSAGGWVTIPQQEWQMWINVAVELAANGVTPKEALEAVKLAGGD